MGGAIKDLIKIVAQLNPLTWHPPLNLQLKSVEIETYTGLIDFAFADHNGANRFYTFDISQLQEVLIAAENSKATRSKSNTN